MTSKQQLKTIGLRTRQGSPFITYVSIKRHEAKHNISVQDNAVFVAGLPLGLDEDICKQIFSCFGEVGQVVLHQSKVSGGGGSGGSHRTLFSLFVLFAP